MIQQIQQAGKPNVCAGSRILSPHQLRKLLSEICEHNASSFATSRKLEAISHIRYGLKSCEFSTNDTYIVQTCLDLHKHFLTVILSSGGVAHKKYHKTVVGIMEACKAFLTAQTL